jgi:hypothetical protein
MSPSQVHIVVPSSIVLVRPKHNGSALEMVEILHLGIIHNNLHPINQNGIRSDLRTSAVYASYRPRLEPQEIVLIALRNAYVVWQAARGCVVKGSVILLAC